MIEKSTGSFIGCTEFMDAGGGEAELGIAITAQKQNMGYGTEAVRAITRYGLGPMGLHRIRLRTRPFNHRAIRVYSKCGFTEYARDDSHVYMEYLPRPAAERTEKC